jgi:hypothetical protein
MQRYCYSVPVAFFRDSPGTVQRIEWYKSDPKAPSMPFATSFSSLQYEMEDYPGEPLVGERYAGRNWRNGLPPYPVSVGGLCGSEEQWAEGASALDPIPGNWPDSAVPRCCNPPPQVILGQIGYGAIGDETIQACEEFLFGTNPPAFFHVVCTSSVCEWGATFDVPWISFSSQWFLNVPGATADRLLQLLFECESGQLIGLFNLVSSLGAQSPVLYVGPTYVDIPHRTIRYDFGDQSAGIVCSFPAGSITLTW